MRKSLLIALSASWLLGGAAMGSQIASIPWNEANLQTLRSFDKAAVVKSIDGLPGRGLLTPQEVDEFGWFDLAGDGKYELVLTASSGPCCEALGILTQTRAGKLRVQNFLGAGQLSKTVRDLNGDGRMELILRPEIAQPGTWTPSVATPRWPAAYRLNKKGRYVEDSRDFPKFYDDEILPELDRAISHWQSEAVRHPAYAGSVGDNAAVVLLEKDKILRVLGRDPTAGLNHAYQWMNSDDPTKLQCAVAIFADICGHDREVREARDKIGPALKHQIEARKRG
jgi:hypothetical protein